jgi:hypothetical protein
MLLTFATANEVYSDYVWVLAWGLIVIALTMITLGYANKGTSAEASPAGAVLIGGAAWLALAIVSYRADYGSFIQADIGEQEVKLYFAGSLYQPKLLKREQLGDVLYGFPGLGEPHSCYIRFVTTSGRSYRSAPRDGKICTEYAARIRSLMKL